MVSLIKVLTLVIAVIVIFVLLVIFLPGITDLFPIDNPLLGDRYRFVRYYACSMAMCLKGCGSAEVETLCLDKDWKGDCEKYCGKVCHDEFGGSAGAKFCGQDYKINVGLTGVTKLRGVLDIIIVTVQVIEQSYVTSIATTREEGDIMRMMRSLYEKHITGDAEFPIDPESFMSKDNCLKEGAGDYKVYGNFLLQDDSSSSNFHSGAIYLDPGQAYIDFDCFGYEQGKANIMFGFSATYRRWEGFEQCDFTGGVFFYTINYGGPEGCTDVMLRTVGTVDPVFFLDAEDKTIPLNSERPITLTLTNTLGYKDSFRIELGTVDEEDLTCHFGGGATTTELTDVAMGATVTTIALCKPTANGPLNAEFIAWDGGVRASAVSIIDTGKIEVDIVKGSEVIFANTGDIEVSDVVVRNLLGEDATIDLIVSTNDPGDTNFGCYVDDASLSVTNGNAETTKLGCWALTESAAMYTVTVTGQYNTGDGLVTADNSINVWVANCKISDLDLNFLPPNPTSGDEVTMTATGFTKCQGKTVNFYLQPGIKLGYQEVAMVGSGDSAQLKLDTTGPGTYTINVSLDANGNNVYDPGESDTKALTIGAGQGAPRGSSTGDNCWFSIMDNVSPCERLSLCLHWELPPLCLDGYPGCGNLNLDPQTDGENDYASFCCIDDNYQLDNGPDDAPCFTVDTKTDNTKTGDMYWEYVNDPRNILTYDNYWAEFKPIGGCGLLDSNCGCSNSDNCNGGSSAPQEMQDLAVSCVYSNTNVNGKPYNVCEVDFGFGTAQYQAWQFIRISDSSRSVYGIKARTEMFCGSVCSSNLMFYLRNTDGDWIYAGNAVLSTNCHLEECPVVKSKTFDIKTPAGIWSWGNINAMLILYYPFGEFVPTYPITSVDYVGLLTKDSTPFCTDGTGEYNRIVDNGQICYWGLDCPSVNNNGWTKTGESEVIAPFNVDLDENDVNDIGCTCDYTPGSIRKCGDGFCEVDESGDRLCYKEVKCKYGGWTAGGVDKCTGSQVCTANGCV